MKIASNLTLDEVQRLIIMRTFKACHKNYEKTARQLGIDETLIRKKIGENLAQRRKIKDVENVEPKNDQT